MPGDCWWCGGWGCRRCTPQPDAGEQGATVADKEVLALQDRVRELEQPIPMTLWCPKCCQRHIDIGEFETKPHHTHSCQFCGLTWRPAVRPTVGVRFLPGFKNPGDPNV